MTKTCWDTLSGIIRDRAKPKVATKDFSTFHNWIILGSALSSKLKELRRTKCALPTKFAFSLSSNRGIVLKKGRTAVVEALFFCPLLTMASPRLLLFLLADTFKWKLPRFEVEDSGKEYNCIHFQKMCTFWYIFVPFDTFLYPLVTFCTHWYSRATFGTF